MLCVSFCAAMFAEEKNHPQPSLRHTRPPPPVNPTTINPSIVRLARLLQAQAKVRSERRSASLRGLPAPRPSPPPNLRHRPSLRCPTRLQASSFEDSGDSDDGDIAVGSYQLRTRRSSRNDRRGAAAAAAVTGSAGNKGSAGKAVGSSSTSSSRDRGNNNNDDGGGDGVGSSRSRGSNNNNNNSSDDSGGGGSGPVTRKPADHRRTSAPEEEDGTASCQGRVGSRPPAGWAQGGRGGAAAAAAEAFGGGEEGRGCKRSFDDHRAPPGDARGGAKEQRAPQRPRWQQEVPQQSIPADAVVVEVRRCFSVAASRRRFSRNQ